MATNTLYKYRSLDPWINTLDILINSRLHAAKFYQLNDPMEGIFTYSPADVTARFIDRMIQGKDKLGICSLSKVHNSTLMWSYYAASHKGIVIGVSINAANTPGLVSVEDVDYKTENVFEPYLDSDPEIEARRVLTRKMKTWQHEQEVRVFSHSQFIQVTLRCIYLGCLMERSTEEIVRKLVKALLPNVTVHRMERDSLDRPIIREST